MELKEIIDYHAKQAVYFAPFGENNELSKFHRDVAETLREVEISKKEILSNINCIGCPLNGYKLSI